MASAMAGVLRCCGHGVRAHAGLQCLELADHQPQRWRASGRREGNGSEPGHGVPDECRLTSLALANTVSTSRAT